MPRSPWVRVVIVLLLALAALLLVRMHYASGAPVGVDSASNGRRLAEAWCSECHSFGAGSPRKSDRAPDFASVANRTSTTELSLKVFLRSTHPSMPNIIIAPEQADDLVQFILSLKRN